MLCLCRKVTSAAEKQLRKLWHTTNIYVYSPLHEYTEKLAATLPDPLKAQYHMSALFVLFISTYDLL